MLRRLIKSIAKQISHLDNVTAMANFYRDRPAACVRRAETRAETCSKA